MGNNTKKIDYHLNLGGNSIYNSNLNTEDIRFIFNDIDVDPGQVYNLDLKARYPYTIEKIAVQTDTGEINFTVAINGTSVTGLATIDATDTITDFTATALNTVALGDLVTLTIVSLTDSPLQLSGSVQIKRT